MQLQAVHHRQLWPPDPVQLISYLHGHYLYRAWKGYSSSPCSPRVPYMFYFFRHVTPSAMLMLQTDEEAEEVIKVDILSGFCLLVGVTMNQRRMLPVTASWLLCFGSRWYQCNKEYVSKTHIWTNLCIFCLYDVYSTFLTDLCVTVCANL